MHVRNKLTTQIIATWILRSSSSGELDVAKNGGCGLDAKDVTTPLCTISEGEYSVSSVIQTSIIQTSIIWHLYYPTPLLSECKISEATPTYEGHMGLGDCEILWNGVFQLSKESMQSAENVIKEKLNICKLMATDRSYVEHYGSRRLTAVAKS